jgi:large subunit ribosomal protein L21
MRAFRKAAATAPDVEAFLAEETRGRKRKKDDVMFAVIKAQGKQYKVAEGDTLTLDRMVGEKGKKVALGEVLMIIDGASAKVGKPVVDGAKVEAEILDHGRDDKILVFKKRRRQGYQRTRGHRQHQTTVKITSIRAG